MKTRTQQIEELQKEWTQPRWEGITRPYSAEDVVKLRGSVNPECTLAQLGAAKMWRLLHGESKKGYINSLGALTGGQALQQAKAGIEAVYLSGWQVAADANLAASMYPDQSLYPANSVPAVVERINNTFRRADQIQWSAGIEPGDPRYVDYFLPIVADAEAGFGGVLNAFELMKAMIEAGAAAVHFEDQLASVKKCGHMGGKVLVPTQEAIQKLVAARLAADVTGVPTLLVARTDADAADLITSDCDPYDSEFITGERTSEGFFRTHAGIEQAISRGLAYAPYADLVWCETSTPDLELARRFALLLKRWLQKSLTRRFSHLNPDQYNGACLLGLRGTVIKSHGAANQRAFAVAIEQAVQAVQRQVPQRIAARLESVYPAGFELLDGGKSGTLR